MKTILTFVALLSVSLSAVAEEKIYMPDFAEGKVTGKYFQKLIAGKNLPKWVRKGGTSSPADVIHLGGKKFYALSGCKPHDCPSQSISVVYSPDDNEIHGLYSEFNLHSHQQVLRWLNLDPSEAGKIRNVLFTRLYDDVEIK